MLLHQNKHDFRDLLPNLNRRKFKHPFVPADIWKSFGDCFDEKRWDRILRKHRIRLIVADSGHDEVCADFYDVAMRINITVPIVICGRTETMRLHLDELKFQILQTAMHELIHVNQFYAHEEQYDRIIGKPSNDIYDEYLSCFGEIQAYAHCCALDQMRGRPNTIFRYNDVSYEVRKKLYRQMNRWIRNHESLNNNS